MAELKTHETLEAAVILISIWLWKLAELLYKQSRSSDPNHPEQFGFIVSLDVPVFVTLGLLSMFALRVMEGWYKNR